MMTFNWGMFWAITAAFALRGVFRHIKKIVLIGLNHDKRGATLQDIWERLL
jgi:hypothetical protein